MVSDVHSWAATVAYAGTGHPPFGRGPSMAIMDRVRRGEHDLTGLPDDLRGLVVAALDPDPARRPGLREIIGRLGGTGATAPAPPRAVVEDPLTLPLALAAQGDPAAPTEVEGPRRAPAIDEPYDQHLDPAYAEPRRTRHLPTEPERAALLDDDEDPDDLPVDLAPVPERASAAAVLRRGLVVEKLAPVAGAVISEWPDLGCRARARRLVAPAHLHHDRDRARRPPSAPRRPLVRRAGRAAPGSLVPRRGSARHRAARGLGGRDRDRRHAAVLRRGASTAGTLFVAGFGVVLGLWVGPGASYVRWPVRVVAHAVARRTGRWAVLTVVLVALAGFVGHQASLDVAWAPFGRPPLIGR